MADIGLAVTLLGLALILLPLFGLYVVTALKARGALVLLILVDWILLCGATAAQVRRDDHCTHWLAHHAKEFCYVSAPCITVARAVLCPFSLDYGTDDEQRTSTYYRHVPAYTLSAALDAYGINSTHGCWFNPETAVIQLHRCPADRHSLAITLLTICILAVSALTLIVAADTPWHPRGVAGTGAVDMEALPTWQY